MMDKIFNEVNPVVRKEDWVLAIKINDNIGLFKEYAKTAMRDNPMEGIQDKLKQTIRDLKGKTETSGEKLAFSTLEKLSSQIEKLKLLKTTHIDKGDFEIEHSVMIGDEGGLYMLLNSLDEQDKQIIKDSG